MIERLYQQHQKWVRIAASFVGNDLAEDIVQETYIKLIKYASDKEINDSYMFMSLRSTSQQLFKEQKKVIKIQYNDFQHDSIDEVNEYKEAYNVLIAKIDEEIWSWHWYDACLFTLYKNNNTSLRKIAKATGISVVSIYNTIKHCKEKLSKKFGEDWQDLTNEDYHLL